MADDELDRLDGLHAADRARHRAEHAGTAAGGVGLRAYLGANTTNGPITVSFDDFAVNSL